MQNVVEPTQDKPSSRGADVDGLVPTSNECQNFHSVSHGRSFVSGKHLQIVSRLPLDFEQIQHPHQNLVFLSVVEDGWLHAEMARKGCMPVEDLHSAG